MTEVMIERILAEEPDESKVQEAIDEYLELRDDLDRYLKENYTGPDKEWPQRWWEPGAEDDPGILPEDQWLPDDEELPFE